MKTFWKYTLTTFLLLFGLAAAFLLYLFCVPNAKLFKLTYIGMNQDIYSENSYLPAGINEIKLESRSYEVRVVPSTSDKIFVKVHANSSGFALVKNSEVKIKSDLNNNVLTFVVNEPHGFTSNNRSFIELKIPENVTSSLNIKNYKANVKIDNESLKVNNLNYSAIQGKLTYKQGEVLGVLNLDLNKSNFILSPNVITNSNAVNISTNNSTFDASSSSLGDIEVLKSVRGVVKVKTCNSFKQNTSAGGRLEVESLNSIDVRSTDTDINIKTLTAGGTISLTKKGDVEIENLNASTYISTKDGKINIKNVSAEIIVESGDGNISVLNAVYTVKATSTYGNITIKFKDDAGKYTPTLGCRTAVATTKSGKIYISGAEHVDVKITDNGRAEVYLNDVLGANQIVGNKNNVYVKIAYLASYFLTTKSEAGNVSVNLVQLTDHNGYTTAEETHTYVNMHEGDTIVNSLSVSTGDGNLTIIDTSWD